MNSHNKFSCILENLFADASILVMVGFAVFGFSFVMGNTGAENVIVDINGTSGSNNVSTNFNDSTKYLFAQANSFLSKQPTSVMDKTQLPASGDRHDFLDLAPYCWPDRKSPNGLPYICQDKMGVNPEFYTVPDYVSMRDMIKHVKTLALAYQFSQNESYASKATDLLRVWFLNGDTKMNPNMQHAGEVRGKNNGTNGGIIAGKDFPEIIDSLDMIGNSRSWTSQDQKGMKLWFAHYLDWLMNSTAGIQEGKSKNNHETWYNAQVSAIALFLNKSEITERFLQKTKLKLIPLQILPDGRQPLELRRASALDYSVWNLLGLFKLANIGEHVGIDLWNFKTDRGAGLQKALDYLLPYLLNKSSWPYLQNDPFDMDKAATLLGQAAIHYPDSEIYKQAYRSLDRKYLNEDIDNLADLVPSKSVS
jgi:Alginate lyase